MPGAVPRSLERYRHRGAEVARCWAKLGLVLLQTSAERLVTSSPSPPAEPSTGQLFFKQLELAALEKQVSAGDAAVPPVRAGYSGPA